MMASTINPSATRSPATDGSYSDGFDRFLQFMIQQYGSLNEAKSILQGASYSVKQMLIKSIFKMVIDVGASMFNAESLADETAAAGAQAPFGNFAHSSAQRMAQMSPLHVAVAAALGSNFQSPFSNQTALPTQNGNEPRLWNVSNFAETTFSENTLSPDAETGSNGNQAAATAPKAIASEKKKSASASASRRKQKTPAKVVSANGGSTTGSDRNSKEKNEVGSKKRSFSCMVSGCKKTYKMEVNLNKHILSVHPNATFVNDGGDAGGSQQQQLINIDSLISSLPSSPKKTEEAGVKRPRMEDIEDSSAAAAGASENSGSDEPLFSSDHLGYCNMPNMPSHFDLMEALLGQSSLNTPL